MDELLASLANLIATQLTEGRADSSSLHPQLINRLYEKYKSSLPFEEANYMARRDWVLMVLKQTLNPAPLNVVCSEPSGAHQE